MRRAIVTVVVLGTLCMSGALRFGAPVPHAQETSPAPVGRLVHLGGRRLHQHCTGSGSPAVVIENGAAAFSIDWTLVQSEVGRLTTVCTYDRAGYAWSDKGPGQDTIEETIDDLHLLLAGNSVQPPFVMVGASLGAIYVRAYQRRFPDQVAGIVFVDGTHDEGITFMSDGKRTPISMLSADELRVVFAQYEKDEPRPGAGKPDEEPLNRLTHELQAVRFWAFKKLVDEVGLLPKGLAAAESWRQEFTALRRLRLERAAPLGSLPLVVLERGHDSNPLWHSQQVDLAGLSSAGRLVTVEGSGHMIHLYNPTVVVQAIRDVVRSVRASHLEPEPARADG